MACLDCATGPLQHKPHEGETEAVTGRTYAGAALPDCEDRLPLFGRNSGTVVIDPKFDVRDAPQRSKFDAPAQATVLYRVVEQIDQDLGQCIGGQRDFDPATGSKFEPRAVRTHLGRDRFGCRAISNIPSTKRLIRKVSLRAVSR